MLSYTATTAHEKIALKVKRSRLEANLPRFLRHTVFIWPYNAIFTDLKFSEISRENFVIQSHGEIYK